MYIKFEIQILFDLYFSKTEIYYNELMRAVGEKLAVFVFAILNIFSQ